MRQTSSDDCTDTQFLGAFRSLHDLENELILGQQVSEPYVGLENREQLITQQVQRQARLVRLVLDAAPLAGSSVVGPLARLATACLPMPPWMCDVCPVVET